MHGDADSIELFLKVDPRPHESTLRYLAPHATMDILQTLAQGKACQP